MCRYYKLSQSDCQKEALWRAKTLFKVVRFKVYPLGRLVNHAKHPHSGLVRPKRSLPDTTSQDPSPRQRRGELKLKRTRKRRLVLQRLRMHLFLHFWFAGLNKIPASLACRHKKEKLVKADHPHIVKVL